MKKLFLNMMLLVASSSFAGNGSSGGGNIFGNQLNPWFLGNTKTVSYCVEISPDFSDVSRERILELINGSFGYWKNAFTSSTGYTAQATMGEAGLLGTQNFILQEKCDKSTDVKFQLGFLTEEQKKSIPNFKQLVGLAYRTSYDEVNLKGKGFVYIAAERGEFRPMASSMHPKPWSNGDNLALSGVLKHELGHIFGLQDDYYAGFGFNLMGATYAESAIKEKTLSVAFGHSEIPSPLGCNTNFEGKYVISLGHIEVNERTQEVLDHFEVASLGDIYEVASQDKVIKLIDKSKATPSVVGEIQLNPKETSKVDVSAVTLYLNKKQKVFNKVDHYFKYNESIQLKRINKQILMSNQVMRLRSGKEIPVFLTFSSSCAPTIGTIINGRVVNDIFGM